MELLSFGDNLTIIKPLSLIEALKTKVKSVLNKYDN